MLVEKDLLHSIRFHIFRHIPPVLMFLLAIAFVVTPAQAAVFNPGCVSGIGNTTALMNAVATSNTNGQADTINLGTNCTYSLISQLSIAGDGGNTLIINGNGSTLDGGGVTRLINVQAGANVTLNSLTIAFGSVASGTGGGIRNAGSLALNDSRVALNTVNEVGGGIFNDGTLTISDSSISSNSALMGGNGGGIYNSLSGTASLINSTVFGNSAQGSGGGFLNNGTVTITNSTLTENSAAVFANGFYGLDGTATLNNTIVANSPSGFDCVNGGGDINASHSLFENGADCVDGTNVNNITGDPSLGTLTSAPNGTSYFPLNDDSIAVNVGSNILVPVGTTRDQAENVRIQGGRVDMGSFESLSQGNLTIQLSLQSRPPAPHASWIISTHLQIRPAAGGSPVFSGNPASNNQGRITINNVLAGDYNVWVKGTHTLARVQAFHVNVGTSNMTTALLLEGDTNDDNQIVLDDFSLLATAYGTGTGQPGFDARADFNADGVINLIDFSLLASNFNQAGAL